MSATKIGHQFAGFVSSSTTATAVFLPAANANGAYIRTGSIVASAPSGNANIALIADTVAPTSLGALSRMIFVANAPPGALTPFHLPYELEIPAGLGVWALADSASWSVTITYDTIA